MKKLLIFYLIIFVAGCNKETEYKSAAEFEAAVASWKLVGLNYQEADALLEKKHFKCSISSCSRRVAYGSVCDQTQEIDMLLDSNRKVKEAKVWSINGYLPTGCF